VRRRWGLAAIRVGILTTLVVLVMALLPSPAPGDDLGAATVLHDTLLHDGHHHRKRLSPRSHRLPPSRVRRRLRDTSFPTEVAGRSNAADIAYALTTYEASDDPTLRYWGIAGGRRRTWRRPVNPNPPSTLVAARSTRRWGAHSQRASVMVVTPDGGLRRRTEFSVVRTLDIRLVQGEAGWEFGRSHPQAAPSTASGSRWLVPSPPIRGSTCPLARLGSGRRDLPRPA
jgi:hypothetical protein